MIGLEDLHWSDPSTLDWIAPSPHGASRRRFSSSRRCGRRQPARAKGRCRVLSDMLRTKQLASEIVLRGLDEGDVARYVAARLPPAPGQSRGSSAWATTATTREATPCSWRPCWTSSWNAGCHSGRRRWSANDDADVIDLGIPDTVRPLIERQVARFPRATGTS